MVGKSEISKGLPFISDQVVMPDRFGRFVYTSQKKKQRGTTIKDGSGPRACHNTILRAKTLFFESW